MTVGLSFVGFLLVGLPISLTLAMLALIYIVVSGNTVLLQSYPPQMFGALENYGMLALPLFILLGEFMNAGGIGRRLMAFALALLGPMRGGLAYVNLGANMMMASILGSTVAQITIMSRLAVPEMERAGYPKDVSVVITAAGGLLAPIIPPSMMFIIFGVIAQVPIGDMFIAGIIPGIVIFVAFCGIIGWLSHRHDFPRSPSLTRQERVRAVVDALPAALIPASIIASILGGFATPTEAATVASLLAILIGLFVYREMTLADIWPALVNAARGAAVVLFLIATAQLFSWVITFENIPATVAAYMSSLTDSPILFLLMMNLLLLGLTWEVEGMNNIMQNWYFFQKNQIPVAHGPGRQVASDAIFVLGEGPDGIFYGYRAETAQGLPAGGPRQFLDEARSHCAWGSVSQAPEFRGGAQDD